MKIGTRNHLSLIKTTVVLILLMVINKVDAQEVSSSARTPFRGVYPPTVKDDSLGFVPIFDGKTLAGWDGDSAFWKVENGEIIGQSTIDNSVKINNFLIWKGDVVKDFELKVDFRINGVNSGIQYRSAEMPEVGKWILRGYQADIDFSNSYSGNIHDERTLREWQGGSALVLSKRGEVTRVVDSAETSLFKSVAKIGDATLLKGVFNINGWNSVHIIARGNVIIQIVNGQLMSVLLDDDKKNFTAEGLIGFQMHVGSPFKVQYKNILYKKL
jgi:hypothetical protein